MVRRIPEAEAASEAEVAEAIRALSQAALAKLRWYARLRISAVGPGAARGRNHHDLLGDAITATLDGTRRWRKGDVDFVTHLVGTMRSISSHWFDEKEISEASPLGDEANDPVASPIKEAPAAATDLDHALDARAQLHRIEELFADDPLAREVLDGLKVEMTGPEIREILGLSQTQYETVMRRIRRKIGKEFT